MAGKIRVRFKGIADVRTISKKDLESTGVNADSLGIDKDLEWSRRNLFELELPANDKLEEVLRGEGHFSISKVEDAGTDSLVSDADNPETEGNILVDGDTGASTEVAPAPTEATQTPNTTAKTTARSTKG